MINWLKHQKRSHLTDNLDWLREQDGEKRSYLTDNFEWLRNDDAEKQQAQGPKTRRPITVHFKKSLSSSVLEVGMWYLL